MIHIVTEYPSWFLPLCVIAGILFSGILYFRLKGPEVNPRLVWLLAALRMLSVTLLTFLLLNPLVKRTIKQLEKPLVIIGLDGSASMTAVQDSAFIRKQLTALLGNMSKKLSGRYEVKTYTFASGLSAGFSNSFSGKATDISAFFNEVSVRCSNRNLGAVVLASDGIYNRGANPFYSSMKLNVPIYSVMVGDTNQGKDVIIKNVLVNRQVYLNDVFPFEVLVEMNKCSGSSAGFRILNSGLPVFSKTLKSFNDHSLIRISGTLQAAVKGMQKFSIRVDTVKGEINRFNNQRDFYVEVLETKIRVALVYESPHPDIAAMVSALEQIPKFEISHLKPSEFVESKKVFDVLIFYQVPSLASLADPVKLLKPGIPVLYILGSQSDISSFNRMRAGLVVNSQKRSVVDIQPVPNPDFTLFEYDPKNNVLIGEFPPLQCPSGFFESGKPTDVLFYQKIGSVSSRFPMIAFFEFSGNKTGVIAGENFWRWRMMNYAEKSDFAFFDEMFSRIVQYLALRSDPSPLRITVKNPLEEGTPMEFDASLFNASHELVNTPDVTMELRNESGQKYPFVFTRTDKAYYLNAGYFSPGNYTWEAMATLGQTTLKKQGQVSVTPADLEIINLVADHNLLKRLAISHGGFSIPADQTDSLTGFLLKNRNLKTIALYQKKYSDLTGNLWIFLLILLLMSAEWAARKRFGL